jgi:hypothetical protein
MRLGEEDKTLLIYEIYFTLLQKILIPVALIPTPVFLFNVRILPTDFI